MIHYKRKEANKTDNSGENSKQKTQENSVLSKNGFQFVCTVYSILIVSVSSILSLCFPKSSTHSVHLKYEQSLYLN